MITTTNDEFALEEVERIHEEFAVRTEVQVSRDWRLIRASRLPGPCAAVA